MYSIGLMRFDEVRGRPAAVAVIGGNNAYPGVRGQVAFYPAQGGTVVDAQIVGLPTADPKGMPMGPFGLHIHDGTSCGDSGGANPFAAAGGHYNPTHQEHPFHVGDLPVMFSNSNGVSYLRTYTARFRPEDVVGRTVIIHDMPDDFRTQPSGDSGGRMACGVIKSGAVRDGQ